MGFSVRVSHPPSHVIYWSCDHVMLNKSYISSFGRTIANNFSKMWLKLSWPQPSSDVTHLLCHYVIFAKSLFLVSQRQYPLDLVRLWVIVKGQQVLLQVPCRSSGHVLFEKRHVSTNSRPQRYQLEIANIIKTHK